MSDAAFTGFSIETTQFLRDLEQNNDKAWFEAHKQTYLDAVQAPARALVVDLGERLQERFPNISYDPRPNGGSLMRIYRDTRFSADKTPYKTNVAMIFSPPGHKRMEAPSFGLQMTPYQIDLVAGIFGFNKDQLALYRAAVIDDKQGTALEAAAAKVQQAGPYPIEGKELKRPPKGYDPEHPRAEWLLYKGLHVFSPTIPLETAYSTDLIDVVIAHFEKMAPIQEWLADILMM